MKYKDLPKELLVHKLMATSFKSPSENRKVFDWCKAVLPSIQFLEMERKKLIEKYGESDGAGTLRVKKENIEKFACEFNQLLEMEIESEIPIFPLSEESFDEESCRYPNEKELWISPKEISTIDNLRERQG